MFVFFVGHFLRLDLVCVFWISTTFHLGSVRLSVSCRTLETDSRDPETETRSLETEKSEHRIHHTLERGLQIITRSFGGSH